MIQLWVLKFYPRRDLRSPSLSPRPGAGANMEGHQLMGPFRVASPAAGAPLPSLPRGAHPLPGDPVQAVGIRWPWPPACRWPSCGLGQDTCPF